MIEINNLTFITVDKDFLKRVAGKVLKKEKKSLELSIALVGPQKIKELNKKYRKKDKITDVLAFGENTKYKIQNTKYKIQNSGEIIICPQRVRKNAKELGNDFKKELSRVLIHGILHLLGESHETGEKEARKMRKKEKNYLRQLKF